jgi:hypothetical protein
MLKGHVARHYAITSILHYSMSCSLCRVTPGECGFPSSDGNPGTNGAIKNSQRSAQLSAKSRVCKAVVAGGGDPGKAELAAPRAMVKWQARSQSGSRRHRRRLQQKRRWSVVLH